MAKHYKFPPTGSMGPAISEPQLIWYSQQGDRDAFASLYDTYLFATSFSVWLILSWPMILLQWSFSVLGKI
jgi:hypothetical protein